MLLEKDMQARFLIPMAISIAAGVAFATVLTLVYVPCLLAALNDLRRIARRIWTGTWPTPEEVEPGVGRNISALDEADKESAPDEEEDAGASVEADTGPPKPVTVK